MSLIEEVESIETPSIRNLNWYYHGIPFNIDDIENILREGIKCKKLLGKKGSGSNGKHFICLSKDIGVDEKHSAFRSWRRCSINIIADNIKARRTVNNYFPIHYLANTMFPIRSSGFQDEFQAYKIIEPDKFVGIQCPLYYWIKDYVEGGYYKAFLETFKNLIIVMKQLESNLPLYDYTRLQGTSVHQINPDAFLEIYDGEIEPLTNEEKHVLLKK